MDSTFKKKLSGYIVLIAMVANLLPATYVQAQEFYGKRTFKVTAYYSPLPDQKFYLKGNYEAEKKLNGNGIAGASGRKVFAGMIAAPKTYAFGTKIQLEGLGIGTVADRGGAIVKAGDRGQEHDRLDVWMGYGDEGLARALKWGVRVVEGEVLKDEKTTDSINVEALKVSLPSPQMTTKAAILSKENEQFISTVANISSEGELINSFPGYMGSDESGAKVRILQAALKRLGYYNGSVTGIYDDNTIMSVLQFQLQYKILDREDAHAAGYFGIETRKILLSVLESKEITMGEIETVALKTDSQPEAPKATLLPTTRAGSMTIVEASDLSIPMPRAQMNISSFSHATIASSGTKPSANAARQIAYLEPSTAKGAVVATVSTTSSSDLSSKEIFALQNQLRSIGYYKDSPSGIWNDKTATGLKNFQSVEKIPQTGLLDTTTELSLDRVWRAHVAQWGFTQELKSGDTIEDVKKLQKLLTSLGFYRGANDGVYTVDLSQSVLDFQIDYGIVADTEIYGAGMVGPRTLAKLNQILFRFI